MRLAPSASAAKKNPVSARIQNVAARLLAMNRITGIRGAKGLLRFVTTGFPA